MPKIERARRLRFLIVLGVATLVACEAPRPKRPTYPLDVRSPEPFATGGGRAPLSPTPPRSQLIPASLPRPKPRVRIGGSETFAFEFRDTPVSDAMRLIADRAGLNFVVPAETAGTITASLPSVTLDQAIDVVLGQVDMELIEDDRVYTVIPRIGPGLERRIYQPRSVDIAAIEPQMRAILDVDPITVNVAANVAYVMSTPERLAQIDELLAVIDEPPREVLIEARIVEVSLEEGFEFGISTIIENISVGSTLLDVAGDLVTPTDNFSIAAVNPSLDLNAVLRTIQSFGRLHVIASPRVLALHQELAKIEIVERIPYIQSTNTTSGDENGVSTTSVEQVEFEEIGIKLHVTPLLGAGNEVTLKILQEVAELVDFFNGVPVTDNRLVDTRFTVRDRETIVIGGLLKERRRENEAGIPWLMDLPLIGRLFSQTVTQTEKTELLVFITPRIVVQGEVMDVSSEYKRELMNKSIEYQQRYQEFLDDVP